jgi:transposase
MKKCSASEAKKVMGLDLGDRKSCYLVVDSEGEIVGEGSVATEPKQVELLFEQWKGCRVVMETGTHSPWVSRIARKAGCEAVVANARQLELISKNRRKGDRVDASLLARLGRVGVDLLAPVEHRSQAAQERLVWQRSRAALVEARTKLINSVRGQVKAWGGRLPKCSTESFSRRVEGSIPRELEEALLPLLRLIAHLSDQIRSHERRIEKASAQDEVVQRWRAINGVGVMVATTYRWTLEDPGRFARSRDVGSYLGLVPRRDQSGETDPQLGITKTGDRRLRVLLVQSAQYILGPFGKECDLRRHGMKLMQGGGKRAKRRAVVAVARKLAVLMHRLWVTGEEYDPDYNLKQERAA